MNLGINTLIIKFVTPLVWKLSKQSKVRAMTSFSMIEKDSAVQLLESLKFTEDAGVRADLFQHVLEEFCHADLFEQLARKYAQKNLNMAVPSREYLIGSRSTYEDFLKFYSYVHVGESEVNEDFFHYAQSAADTEMRNTFLRVASDENKHESDTEEILYRLCKDDKKARNLLFMSKLKRRYKIFSASMRSIGHVTMQFLLTALYFAFGPFLKHTASKQFGWTKEKHLDFLKHQAEQTRPIE